MKVLLAADFSYVHSRRYLELISKTGSEVVLLETGKFPQLSGELAGHYHRWPRAGRSLLRHVVGNQMAERIGNLLVDLQLRFLWLKIKPDICHVQWIDESAQVLSRIGLCPVVLTSWGTDIRATADASCDPRLRQCKLEAVSNAALLIADSEDIIDIATALAKRSISTALIPIGIDTKVFTPDLLEERIRWRKELAIPQAATVALSPRGFQARYGHHTIVSAFGRAVARGTCDAYLILKRFNSDDPDYLTQVSAIAASGGIQDRVRILDEVSYEKLPGFYSMGDFAINFPDADAFPVTFMECLACGVPVLTKKLPAYESFGIGRYLRFADGLTEQALEMAIFKMFSECHSMEANMTEARSFVFANFDEAVVARGLLQAYQRVLGH